MGPPNSGPGSKFVDKRTDDGGHLWAWLLRSLMVALGLAGVIQMTPASQLAPGGGIRDPPTREGTDDRIPAGEFGIVSKLLFLKLIVF